MFRAVSIPLLIFVVGVAGISMTPFSAAVALFGALDIIGRRRDYNRLARLAYIPLPVADNYGRSWCGRRVVGALTPWARGYYYSKGYRWWHVMPDGFPLVVFRRNFWCSLIGERK